jgi:hypothetical protein
VAKRINPRPDLLAKPACRRRTSGFGESDNLIQVTRIIGLIKVNQNETVKSGSLGHFFDQFWEPMPILREKSGYGI